MILGNDFAFAGNFFQWYRLSAVAARGYHHAKDVFVDQIRAGRAQP